MKKLFIFLIIVLQTVASIAQTAAELSKKALEFYVNKKYTKAVEYWNMAREKGDGDAYAFLAMCYEKGQGVKTDKEKQKSLLEQGAEMGNNMCLNDLGSYYFNGEGGMTNKGKAFDYYNRAAINGNETAQKNLGLCYEEGVGTEVNLRMAAMWYRVADISGDHAALNRYTQLSYKGYKLSKEEAVRFIENGYKLPDNPQMSDNTPVKGVSPSPIKINQGSCDNAGLAKTSYFHFHILLGQFWGSGKFYISFNGGGRKLP